MGTKWGQKRVKMERNGDKMGKNWGQKRGENG